MVLKGLECRRPATPSRTCFRLGVLLSPLRGIRGVGRLTTTFLLRLTLACVGVRLALASASTQQWDSCVSSPLQAASPPAVPQSPGRPPPPGSHGLAPSTPSTPSSPSAPAPALKERATHVPNRGPSERSSLDGLGGMDGFGAPLRVSFSVYRSRSLARSRPRTVCVCVYVCARLCVARIFSCVRIFVVCVPAHDSCTLTPIVYGVIIAALLSRSLHFVLVRLCVCSPDRLLAAGPGGAHRNVDARCSLS